jgi:3-oxoacyl-[acyl-carrier-protein] synthase II
MKKRVVITGLGAVTPLGNDVQSFWQGIKEGKSGFFLQIPLLISPVSINPGCRGEKDLTRKVSWTRKNAKRIGQVLSIRYGLLQKKLIRTPGLDSADFDRERFGVIVGSGIGGLLTIEEQHSRLLEKGPGRVSPFFIPMAISNMAAGNIAIKLNARGICTCIVTACATATHSIGESFHKIRNGEADIILTGGSEAPITPLAVAGFTSMTALSSSSDPLRASIPFDKERDGFVMGEGDRHPRPGGTGTRPAKKGQNLCRSGRLWRDL